MNYKIDAEHVSLESLMDHSKSTVEHFQREYWWERMHVEQLINDLTTSFMKSYDATHEKKEVTNYNCYFLGPISISNKDGLLSIIDGQQRITSLTLLLIYMNTLLADISSDEAIDTLIYTDDFGKRKFSRQVEERQKCLTALYDNVKYEGDEDDESVRNMVDRFSDIVELFPEEFKYNVLPYFISWLKEKVVFIKMITYI